MPTDIQTRRVVSGLLVYSIYYQIILLIGIITGIYLLGPIFLQNVETAWLVVVLALYGGRAVRKAVRSHTRAITWTFAFKAIINSISAMALLTCFLLSLNGHSVIFGEITNEFIPDIYYGLGWTIFLLILGYMGVTAITAAIVRHTSVRTMILTKAFITLGVIFFASMLININGVIPWLKDLDLYLLYLLIVSYYGVMITHEINSKFAKYVEKKNLTTATLRDWMEYEIKEA